MNCLRRSGRRLWTFAMPFCGVLLFFSPAVVCAQSPSPSQTETVAIDMNAKAHAFPHFWEEMFGSGGAILSLRQS